MTPLLMMIGLSQGPTDLIHVKTPIFQCHLGLIIASPTVLAAPMLVLLTIPHPSPKCGTTLGPTGFHCQNLMLMIHGAALVKIVI
jgi:hypothetical protein